MPDPKQQLLDLCGVEDTADIHIGWHYVFAAESPLRAAGRVARFRREELGVTVESVAEVASVRPESVREFEGGKVAEDLAPKLSAIENALELPTGVLVALSVRIKERSPAIRQAVHRLAFCDETPGPERDEAYAAMLHALGAA